MGPPLLASKEDSLVKDRRQADMDKVESELEVSPAKKHEPATKPQDLGINAQDAVNLNVVLKEGLADVKSLVTCSICDQLLYEPWTLACGHTYCYSCLCNWFVPNKRKKTCPDCRTAVKQMPAPSFIIKQMVNLLMGRSEILPPDETILQHKERAKDETEAVEKDRNDPEGLFKGTFPTRATYPLLYDEADQVARCPGCQHEYEGGSVCSNCHHRFDRDDEHYFSDEDDFEMDDLNSVASIGSSDLADAIGHELATHRFAHHRGRAYDMADLHHFAHATGDPTFLHDIELHPFHGAHQYHYPIESSDMSDDDEDDLSDHTDDLDDRDEEDRSDDSEDSEDGEDHSQQQPHRRRNQIILSDSDDMQEDDDDYEDEEEVIAPGRRARRQQRAISVISDDISEDDVRGLQQAGWGPLSPNPNATESADDHVESTWSPLASASGGSQSERTVVGNSDDEEDADVDDLDEDGDTEMSAAGDDYNTPYNDFLQRADSLEPSGEPGTYGYASTQESGTSSPAPSSKYGDHNRTEELGMAHQMHNEDSSDESDTPLPPTRRQRNHYTLGSSQPRRVGINPSLIQQGLMSGNQTERNGRIHLLPPQYRCEPREIRDFAEYMAQRPESHRWRHRQSYQSHDS